MLSLLLACSPSPQAERDTAPAEPTDTAPPANVALVPLHVDGLETLTAHDHGLTATWTDATGGTAPYSYTLSWTGTEAGSSESAEIALPDGTYTVCVTVTDAAEASFTGPTCLEQVVGDQRLVLLSETDLGSAADVWGQGDTVVLTGGYDLELAFAVVDVADASNPEVLATVPRSEGGYVKDAKIDGQLLVTNGECGCGSETPEWEAYDKLGARVWDLSDPAEPTLLGSMGEPSTSVHNVALGNGHAFLTDNIEDSVHIWSLEDPAQPVFVAQWRPPEGGMVHDQAFVDGKLYVAFWSGFAVLDVQDPAKPVELVLHTYEGGACHNAWPTDDGSHVLTTDETAGGHVRIWDVRDPAAVEQVAEVAGQHPDHSVHNVHVRDDHAYVSWYIDGVVVLDVSEPANPVEVARYDTHDEPDDPWGGSPVDTGDTAAGDTAGEHSHQGSIYSGAWGVWPFGEHLAVSDMSRGLLLFDHFPEVVAAD